MPPWEKYAAPAQGSVGPWAKYAETATAAPAPEEEMGWLEYANNLARAAANGITFGHADELAGAVGALGGNRSYSEIRNEQDQGIRDFRESNPVAAYGAEIGGSVAMPLGAVGALKGGITAANVAKGAATVGAPMGAATAIGDAKEINSVGDFAGEATKGALLGGLGYGVAAPIAAGLARGAQSVGRAVGDAIDPESAAYRKWAAEFQDAKLDPSDLRKEVAPKLSPALKARGMTETDVTGMVSRVKAGESTAKVAQDHGVAETTVNRYVREYNKLTKTPTNILDLSSQVARQQGRTGAEEPVLNLARAAATQSGEGPAIAAERMGQRQIDQQDRMVSHLGSLVGGKDPEAVLANLDDVITKQSTAAYGAAKQNAQPFDLRPAIRKWRNSAFQSAGDIKTNLEKALDLFYEPLMVQGAGNTMTVRKLGKPISDLRRYQGARQALDHMVETSMKDGKATTLTRALTRFRRDINETVRKANPMLAQADDAFSGASGAKQIMEKAAKLSPAQTEKTISELRRFAKMTPEQKEAFRLGFRQKLETLAQSPDETADSARQFLKKGAQKTIRTVFDKKEADAILRDFARERATTRTFNKVFAGSRTAPLANQAGQMINDAQIAGSALTGNLGALYESLKNKLVYQIGNRQSKEILDIATRTDPDKLLPILDRIISSGAKLDTGSFTRALVAAGVGGTTAQELARRL
jgi:hypothetical protein